MHMMMYRSKLFKINYEIRKIIYLITKRSNTYLNYYLKYTIMVILSQTSNNSNSVRVSFVKALTREYARIA